MIPPTSVVRACFVQCQRHHMCEFYSPVLTRFLSISSSSQRPIRLHYQPARYLHGWLGGAGDGNSGTEDTAFSSPSRMPPLYSAYTEMGSGDSSSSSSSDGVTPPQAVRGQPSTTASGGGAGGGASGGAGKGRSGGTGIGGGGGGSRSGSTGSGGTGNTDDPNANKCPRCQSSCSSETFVCKYSFFGLWETVDCVGS